MERQQFVQMLPTLTFLYEWRSAGEHVPPGTTSDRRAEVVLVRVPLLKGADRRRRPDGDLPDGKR